jgi:hypothetical protein
VSPTASYTLSGLNFQPGAQVIFRPGPAQTTVIPTFVDAKTLRITGVIAQPGAAGAVAVQVLNPDGGWFTKPAAFSFPAASAAFGKKGFIAGNLSSTGLDVADVNGDGRADVVHSGAAGLAPYSGGLPSTTGGLILHLNLGGAMPTFSSIALDSVNNYYDVKFADVNLDGRLDVVALGQTAIRTWLNGVGGAASGTFTAGPVSTLPTGFSWPSEMAVGMLDSDAIPDVAFGVPHYPTSNVNGRVYAMKGSGTGAFTLMSSAVTSIPNTYGVISLACVDVDGNGRSEVVAGVGMNPITGPIANLATTTTAGAFGTWTPASPTISSPLYGSTTGVAVGDFLGLGRPSQVVAFHNGSPNYSNGRVLRIQSGAGLAAAVDVAGVPSSTGKCVAAVDADFDTRTDIAVTAHSSLILVYRGATLANPTILDAGDSTPPALVTPITGRVASGDLDGDGRPDLLATTSYWAVNGMAANYGSFYTLGTCGDGGSRGIVFYLNASN